MTHWFSHRRILASALLGVFGILIVSLVLFAQVPRTHAQAEESRAITEAALEIASGACTGMGPCPLDGQAKALDTVSEKLISPQFRAALLSTLLNLFTFVLDRLAYEAAVAIASGGEGQQSLFYGKDAAANWEQFGLDIAGEAIGNLSDLVDDELDIAFDFCAPGSGPFGVNERGALINLALQIGIRQAYQPQEPRCDFRQVQQNWQGFVSTTTAAIGDAGPRNSAILAGFAQGLRPGANELSAAIKLNIGVHEEVLAVKSREFDKQLTSQGYKDVRDVITGKVKTPASLLQKNFENELIAAKQGDREVNMNAVVNAGELIGQMALHTAGVFTNTLLSQLFNRVYTGLFEVDEAGNPLNIEAPSNSGIAEAKERFASIISPTPVQATEYNVLTEFLTCPSGGVVNRGLNNCVMDASFAAAVARGEGSAGITVQQAIDEGLLHGDWPLISPDDTSKNQDPFCYTYGYCYGNLVKLRKARILPVGWELAAERNTVSNPMTLQEIINEFDTCREDGGGDVGNHKFCHLIDPNWILKYPETQCRAMVNGQLTATALGGGRASTCVDTPSCLSENDQGQCDGGYGYCVREKNVWRFRGQECPEQYASCLTLENTHTSTSASYLVNTVDFSVCGQDNAGCQWYRTDKRFFDGGDVADPANENVTDDSYEWLRPDEAYVVAEYDDNWRFEISNATQGPWVHSYTSASGLTYTEENWADEDRVYLNHQVDVCTEQAAGCTELYRVENGLTSNVIINPSLETDEDNDGAPDGWILGPSAVYLTDGSGLDGFAALAAPSTAGLHAFQYNILLAPNEFYTLSYSAKSNGASSTNLGGIIFTDVAGQPADLSGTTTFGDCADLSSPGMSAYAVQEPAGSEFEEFTCTFTTTEWLNAWILVGGSNTIYDNFQLEVGTESTLFTEGYNDPEPTTAYLTVAPQYLGCTGAETDPAECDDYAPQCTAQDVGCSLYTPENGGPNIPAITSVADICPAECVGYTTYKQEATAYDDERFPLFFIADRAQECAAQHVGCDGFTNLDAVADGGEGQEYYSNLRACLTPEMATSSANRTSSTFFTWEGSDVEGFQLRTWQLLESESVGSTVSHDAAPELAPCTQWSVTATDVLVCDDIGVLPGSDSGHLNEVSTDTSCNEHADIFENPDCREFFDDQGNVHYRLWSQTVTVSDQCHPYRKNESEETSCENSGGFWTEAGFCRYFGLPEESVECPSTADGCRLFTGGAGRNSSVVYSANFEDESINDWFPLSGATSLALSNEALSAGGRSMRIMTPAADYSVAIDRGYIDNDESYPNIACSDADGCASTNSIGRPSSTIECTTKEGDHACSALSDVLSSGKTYMLRFWAKGDQGIYASFRHSQHASATQRYLDFVNPTGEDVSRSGLEEMSLSADWQLYELGPVYTGNSTRFNHGATLYFSFPEGNKPVYLDNIELVEVEENIPRIKDSWVVPSTCDQTPSGVNSPQYYLGCQAYTDQNGDQENFYQFTNLCSENVVGCEMFYNTQNTDSPTQMTYNARCVYDTNDDPQDGELAPSQVICEDAVDTYCTIAPGQGSCRFNTSTIDPASLPPNGPGSFNWRVVFDGATQQVPNDTPVYLVDNGQNTCQPAFAGCQEVGRPVFNQARTRVTGFESKYIINDPDQYFDADGGAGIMCTHEALFCEEFTTSEGVNYYFKRPDTRTCEYKTGVDLSGVVYSGWFQSGTSTPCDWTDTDGDGAFTAGVDTAYTIGGDQFGVWRNGDPDYDGWVASCPASHNQCTQFVDPVDVTAGSSSSGVSYYYVNDDQVQEDELTDGQKCNGLVSQSEGCALFYNTTDTQIRYNASASYTSSNHADVFHNQAAFSATNPINCAITGGGVVNTPDGPFDLCANRCKYSVSDQNAELISPMADHYSTVGEYAAFERSCYVDSDCPSLETTLGVEVTGTCQPAVFTDVFGQEQDYTLVNDTNVVLKVNRSRECAAWLACTDTRVSWDQRQSRYVPLCSNVRLCTSYSATAGSDTAFCTEIADTDPVVLSAREYSLRDVSWNGWDYAGYAIPNQLPVEHYDQINVNPDKWCYTASGEVYKEDGGLGLEVSCVDTADCEAIAAGMTCDDAETDYRLVHNAGPCDEAALGRGEECVVGFCEDNGWACADDSDCDLDTSENCVVGYCQEVSEIACTSGNDCAATPGTPICDPVYGLCVDDLTPNGTSCTTTSDCPGAETCTTANTSAFGSCFNNQCLASVRDSDANEIPDRLTLGTRVAPAAECRGYPEAISPFEPSKVVEKWRTSGSSDTTPDQDPEQRHTDAAEFAYGFQNVNTCAPVYDDHTDSYVVSDDCTCSYQKIEYGDGAFTRYYPEDSDVIATVHEQVPQGICAAGSLAGQACREDNDCVIATADGNGFLSGTCLLQTANNVVYGWEGLCIETDSSIQRFGSPSPEDQACLTWLPVDQLKGATDLYGKFVEAGYPLEDTYYCSDVSTYTDVRVSNYEVNVDGMTSLKGADWNDDLSGVAISCAQNENSSCGQGQPTECLSNVHCPEGFFAILGPCRDEGDDDDNLSGACTQPWASNDCPFVCVPKNSRIGDQSCDPINGDLTELGQPESVPQTNVHYFDGPTAIPISNYEIDVFPINDPGSFDNIVHEYLECVNEGVELGIVGLTTQTVRLGSQDHYRLYLSFEQKLACEGIARVAASSTDLANKAWTNRVWESGGYTVVPGNGYEDTLGYYYGVDPEVFGAINTLPDQSTHPIKPNYCSDDEYGDLYIPYTDNSCEETHTLSSGNGRSYQYFSTDYAQPMCDTDLECAEDAGISCNTSATSCLVSCENSGDCSFDYDSDGDGTDETFTLGSCLENVCENPFPILSQCEDIPQDATEVSGVCEGGELDGSVCPGGTIDCLGAVHCGPNSVEYNQGGAFGDDSGSDQAVYSSQQYCQGPSFGGVAEISPGADTLFADVQNRLSQLFATVHDYYTFDDEQINIVSEGTSNSFQSDTDEFHGEYAQGAFPAGMTNWNITGVGDGPSGDQPSQPIVRSVEDCVGVLCEEGPDNSISVNLQSSGTISGVGTKHTTVNFFVEANPNQMPIKNIILDWGDGEPSGPNDWPMDAQSGSTDPDGNFYRNNRGIIQNVSGTSLLCNETSFGTAQGACDTAYVTFTHDYVCTPSIVNDWVALGRTCQYNDAGDLINSPCIGTEAQCVFQPRVHVRDNWGWCTGECESGTPDSVEFGERNELGCYDSSWADTIIGTKDECDFEDCPGPFCDAAGIDPWTYYNGEVHVYPEQ